MTATAHALIGGAIAASVGNPSIGLPLSAISHPLTDMIPHWDFGVGWKKKTKTTIFIQSSLDLAVGIILTYLIFGSRVESLYLWGCVFLSEAWDLLMMPHLLGFKFWPFSAFYRVQSALNQNVKLPWGILTQAGTVISIVLLLQLFKL